MIPINSFLSVHIVLIRRPPSYLIGWFVIIPLLFVWCSGMGVIASDAGQQTKHNPLARHIELSNESGEQLQIEWIHPITGEIVPYGVSEPNLPNHHFKLDSSVNHTFIVRTIMNMNNSNQTSQNNNSNNAEANMRSTRLIVGHQEKQNYVVTKDLVLYIVNDTQSSRQIHVTQSSKLNTIVPNNKLESPSESSLPADDTAYIISKCREKYKYVSGKESSSDDIVNKLIECFRNETASVLMI